MNIIILVLFTWLLGGLFIQRHPAVKGQPAQIRLLTIIVGPPLYVFDLICYGAQKVSRKRY